MKVLEHTANRLKLQHVPIGQWVSGGLAVTFSLAGLVYLVGVKPVSATLHCRHISSTQTSCELRQFTWAGGMQTHKIYDLQSATVVSRLSGRRSRAYHVELFNGVHGIAFLTDADGGRTLQETIAAQINQFLSTPDQTALQLQQSGRTQACLYSLLGLFGLGSGVVMSRVPATVCTFYKRLNKVVLERKRWCGSKQTIERSLQQVQGVEIEEKRVKYGKMYRSVLVLNSAERLPLNPDYTPEKDVREATYQIQKFLS